MRRFLVTAERGEGNWWVLACDETGSVSQVRHLDDAAEEMREALAYQADISEKDIEVQVEVLSS